MSIACFFSSLNERKSFMARRHLISRNQIDKVKTIVLQIHKALCPESRPFEKQNVFLSLYPAVPLSSYEECLGATSLIKASSWSQHLQHWYKRNIIANTRDDNGSAINTKLCGCNMLLSMLLNDDEFDIKTTLCIITVSSKLRANNL